MSGLLYLNKWVFQLTYYQRLHCSLYIYEATKKTINKMFFMNKWEPVAGSPDIFLSRFNCFLLQTESNWIKNALLA